MFSLSTLLLSTLSLLPVTTLAAVTGNDNVALYWGQNSAGGSNTQQRLSYYCGESASDIVLISFLTSFSGDGTLPTLNVANACEGTYFAGTTLLQCDTIAEDIATCQAAGKKVLLSMGGASGAYGISSSDHATALANQLWNIFGGGSSNTRPFGTSIIDGFDLDIEGGSSTYYPDFVTAMRANYATDTSRSYYISAAPQCPIPDAYVGEAITKSDIDFLFVQFYNNYCGMQALNTPNFNFAAWDALVKSGSKNANAKVYLGVPGSATAAGSGYVDVNTVVDTALSLQSTYDTFGGVMIWDASQAWANNNFANVVKAALVSGSSGSKSTSTSKSASTSPTTSTSSTSTSVSTSSVVVVPVTTSSSTKVIAPVTSSSSIVVSSVINKGVESHTIVSVSSAATEETSSSSTTSPSSSSTSATSTNAETTTSTSTSMTAVVPATTSLFTSSAPSSSSSPLSTQASPTEASTAEESSTATLSVSTVTKSTLVYVFQSGSSVASDDQTIIILSTQTSTVSGTTTITSNRPSRTTSPDSYEVTHVTSTTTVGATSSVQLASTALIVAAVSGSALQSVSQVGITEVVRSSSSAVSEVVAATTTSTTTSPATSTNTSPTTSSSSSSAASSTAVLIADGDACSTIGEMSCSGSQFAVCDNYKWVLRDCAAGTVCYSYGDSLFCGWPGVKYF